MTFNKTVPMSRPYSLLRVYFTFIFITYFSSFPCQVVEIMSSAITDLMQAEFTRFSDHHSLPPDDATVSEWEEHTFLASGSLIAKSCKSTMLMAQHSDEVQQKMFDFGRHVAFTRQVWSTLTLLDCGYSPCLWILCKSSLCLHTLSMSMHTLHVYTY